MKSAVLFLVFNRPDTTREVFKAIRAARPPRLYVAADGPRPHKEGEAEKCRQVREIVNAVDWPCEVSTLFRDHNLGCKLGVSSGITWFFDNEEEGIILEDDVLPQPGFFRYCEELLERYRNDDRIASICGCNNVPRYTQVNDSYFFSNFNLIWGWASWRRSWEMYDLAMSDWPEWRDGKGLQSIGLYRPFEAYWSPVFEKTHANLIDTWDYQWMFSCWRNGKLTILPKTNLIENLGFREDATHTTGDIPDYVRDSVPQDLDFPLTHPVLVQRNQVMDRIIQDKVFRLPRFWRIKWIIERNPLLNFIFKKIKGRK